MFRVLDIYIIQDFSLWFYYFLGVAFNFTMNQKFCIKMFDKVRIFVLNFMLPSSRSYPLLTFRRERAARKVGMAVKG